MQGSRNSRALVGLALVLAAGLGASWYLASGKTVDIPFLADPCQAPVRYAVATFDARFGISRAEFDAALRDAAKLWNDAAGRQIVFASAENAVSVNLVYGEHQQTAQLGKSIDAEQQAYLDKREEVEGLREEYLALRSRATSRAAAFERSAKQYEEDVAYWNARGGAPPGEYEKLEAEQARLAREQEAVNDLVGRANAKAKELNGEVDELNRLAARTNAKVGAYNKRAGTDFDQGTYTEDEEGKRIDIYEFTDRTELKRVLAHEFGHALGLVHVENPESIMYSYNIGESFALSQEDVAALKELCRLE